MTKTGDTSTRSEFGRDVDKTSDRLEREKQDASQAFSEASDAMRRKATQIGSELSSSARQQAEGAQRDASDALHTFAGAVRGAGDDLKRKNHSTTGSLVSDAAQGIEQLSDAIANKRLDDVTGDVRRFGRQNPAAFVAASVLAGIAIGRFVRSSGRHRHDAPADQPRGSSIPPTRAPGAAASAGAMGSTAATGSTGSTGSDWSKPSTTTGART